MSTLSYSVLKEMEAVQDVVIVGAGLSGLATALGLHRKGIKSLVLESSDALRASGFAFVTWSNAWRAMDALGVADYLRRDHHRLQRVIISSASSGAIISQFSLTAEGKCGVHEGRCVRRNVLLEALAKELPKGAIRYSSKVVLIDEDGDLKLLHLADGSILKAKVIVGCDGVNSSVARYLGVQKPSFSGRSASRGFTVFPNGHGFKPEFIQFSGKGFRCGFLPCDDKSVYWFFTWTPAAGEEDVVVDTTKMKQFIISKMRTSKVPEEMARVVEMGEMGSVVSSPLRFRSPFDLIWGTINKGSVCVAGDALHAMTPDLGQGGCAALEDGVVLARCLGEALLGGGAKGDHERVRDALEKYAKERRWRSFKFITMSYLMGYIQQSDGAIMDFLRDKALARTTENVYLNIADFDCGRL